MGEESNNILLYISKLGEVKVPAPKGIVWEGISEIKLNEPNSDMYENNKLYLEKLLSPVSFTCKIKPKKFSRKKYKKYLMSLRCSRDYAEKMCKMVSSFKGKISYNQMLFYPVIFGPDRG